MMRSSSFWHLSLVVIQFAASTCSMLALVFVIWSCWAPPLWWLVWCHLFHIVGSSSLWQLGKWWSCLVYLIPLSRAAMSLFLLKTLHTFRCSLLISYFLDRNLCFSPGPSNLPLSLMDVFCHSECRWVPHCISFVSHHVFSILLKTPVDFHWGPTLCLFPREGFLCWRSLKLLLLPSGGRSFVCKFGLTIRVRCLLSPWGSRFLPLQGCYLSELVVSRLWGSCTGQLLLCARLCSCRRIWNK